MKILIADSLPDEALQFLKKNGSIEADVKPNLSSGELLDCIGEYEALIVRSKTKVTEEVLESGSKLRAIGRAGVGLDNIDVEAATRRGIVVMNTPDANTISTAELTMSLLLALSRHLYQATSSLKNHKWEKEKLTGVELHGKVLGIIGLGRIGSQVARRALSFGMRLVAYDPFISSERAKKREVKVVDLKELLAQADYISIHTPLTDDTRYLLREKEFKLMKDGVRIINCARGGLIDEDALCRAIKGGKVAGCALDVFEKEPSLSSPLLDLEQVIATPHIGASTKEARINVAIQIVKQVIDALNGEMVQNAVNFPQIAPEIWEELKAYVNLAERLGKLESQLIEGPLQSVKVTYVGEMNNYPVQPITVALLKGLLEPILSEDINYVNASFLAEERGIEVIEVKGSRAEDFANLITVEVKTTDRESSIAGTLFGRNDPRIVRINSYHVDAVPEGYLLICSNHDKPGAIAHISTVLSRTKINIAGMTVGRKETGGKAITVLNIDNSVSPEVVKQIKKDSIIVEAKLVKL